MNKRQKGTKGETIAANELIKKGYEIVERNYNTRTSEIDIIAKKGNLIVFVEVKLRTNLENGSPAEAVNDLKQKRILEGANYYIAKNELLDPEIRFDVAEVLITQGRIYFRYIENAFWE